MSHPLPVAVIDLLAALARQLDEGLQADGHHVGTAMGAHEAFDQRYIDTTLTRALVCSIARSTDLPGLSGAELAIGGCDVKVTHEDTIRLFRLKKATLDAAGNPIVRVNNDSILTRRAKDPTLPIFEDDESLLPTALPEQWVLAYLINPATRTISQIHAGLPVGVRGQHSPFRLILAHVVRIPHAAPPPAAFPKTDDHLLLDAEEVAEQPGEARRS